MTNEAKTYVVQVLIDGLMSAFQVKSTDDLSAFANHYKEILEKREPLHFKPEDRDCEIIILPGDRINLSVFTLTEFENMQNRARLAQSLAPTSAPQGGN